MDAKIEELLHKSNPWWHKKEFQAQLGLPRHAYVERISKAFSIREIKVLYGVRRSGKSTLLYQIIRKLLDQGIPPQNIALVNLENNLFAPWIAQRDFLDRLFETIVTLHNPQGKVFLFLDEIQEAPFWEKWVTKMYEQKSPLQITVTGSSSSMQSTELATLLTGRNLSFEIKPLNFQEYLFFKTGHLYEKKDYDEMLDQKTELAHYFERYLQEGGFPGIVLTQDETLKENLLKQYFQDILYRDLVRKYEVRHPVKLENLAFYLASNIGRALSYRKISATMGLAVDTLKEYLSHFERAGLFSFLGPFTFSSKAKLREVHNRKIYIADHGLRNVAALGSGRDTGFTVENLVFHKLKGEKLLGYTEAPEIDFAFSRAGIHLIQVCYEEDFPPRELEAFEKLRLNRKVNILISKNTYQPVGKIKILPAWYYLL
ncbi:MAG: ATP-binding protein [Candidatus Omnitrophica bacterium]|nr:ATP-binding protein [Candidatus Omnitrophota bacterium]